MAEKLKISVHVDPKVNKEELRSTIIAAAKSMKAVEINIKPAIKMNHLHAALQREFNKLPPVQIRVAPSVSTELQTSFEAAVTNALKNANLSGGSGGSGGKSGNRRSSGSSNSQDNSYYENTLLLRDMAKKSNLSRQISTYLNNNKAVANNDFANKTLADLREVLKKSGSDVDLVNEQFTEFRAHFKQLGLETPSLAAALGKLFKDHLGTQAVLLGINAIRKSFIKMISDVTALDTAMTELKKVTDETDQSYIDFLDRATVKAQTLGATISDVVTATADFARLGYSMDDAEQLAEAAIVYKNVGDGIEDISVASSSIISTMKAFGIEASEAMSIVDKFNLTGNKFAISSSGVGEALSRSAAGLAETNNSLSESIALITAAM